MKTFIGRQKTPVVPLFVFGEGTFPLTLIISYHVTTSCFLFLNVIYCFAPPLESDLSERIAVTIRACLLPPSSVCTSYHPPGAAEGGITRCCSYCSTNDSPARQERRTQCLIAKMNLLIREMTFEICILSVIERRIRTSAKKVIAVVWISFCPQAAVDLM